MANDQALVLRFGVDIGQAQKQLSDLSKDVSKNMETISDKSKKASDDVSKGFDQIGRASQTVGQRLRDLSTLSGVTRQLDDVITKTNQAQGELQKLQGRFSGLKTQFMSGEGKSAGDLKDMLFQAGSLKNFAALAGGPLGLTALVGGAAYGQLQQFAAIGDLADKARASAQEVEGLGRVLGKLGVDTSSANGIIGALSDKLATARQFGGDFKDKLDSLGISIKNSDGSARSAVAVLGDLASRIKNTTDESERMKLATIAVGDQLAGPFLDAINKSKTGLADIEAASRAAGSSFTNDLAKGAQAGMKALDELGKRADGVYAQIKRALNLANEVDRIKAAQEDLRQTSDEGARLARGKSPASYRFLPGGVAPDGTPVMGIDQDEINRNALEYAKRTFALEKLDGTAERAEAFRKALAASMGPKLPPGGMPPTDDDEDAVSGRSRGGGRAAAASAEDDRAERVLQRLRERLAATKAISDETGTLGEKQRIINELVNAGVTAESDMGREIASLVRQIDEQTEAQRRFQAAMNELRTAANSVEGALDGWIVQGRKFDDVLKGLLKQLESQALRGVFNQLFDGASGKSGGGGLLAFLGGFFGSKAEGGYIGAPGAMAFAPFSAFANAKHYADGGGIPIIAHPGEIILNRAQQMNVASGLTPKVIFNVDNAAGAHIPEPSVKQTQDGLAISMRVMDAKIAANNQARDFQRRPPRVL